MHAVRRTRSDTDRYTTGAAEPSRSEATHRALKRRLLLGEFSLGQRLGEERLATLATHAMADLQQVTDAKAEAWRAAVYQEMASLGTCAITESGAGSGALFSSKVICNHFSGDQPVDGNLAFVLTELPANLDTTYPGWQRKAAEWDNSAQFNATGVSVGADAMMFVETSNGTTRRVAVVTRTHVVLIAAEMIADKYLPSVDALTTAARRLNDLADSVLAAR